MTLALRVLAAPDHAPGSVVPLPVDGGPYALGAVVDVGQSRCVVVEAIDVWDGAYSYGQIVIQDASVELTGLWTERHHGQGFVRGDGHVTLRTLGGSGHALVRAFTSHYVPLAEDHRVIAVPFRVTSGTVRVMAPDDVNIVEHTLELPPGDYRLVTCQRFIDHDEVEGDQDLDLFFERVDLPRQRSEVLVADRELQPELPLLETDRA